MGEVLLLQGYAVRDLYNDDWDWDRLSIVLSDDVLQQLRGLFLHFI